jgi:hypothetical protein
MYGIPDKSARRQDGGVQHGNMTHAFVRQIKVGTVRLTTIVNFPMIHP